MGLGQLATIRDRLLAHGRAAETPAAIVVAGTMARQQVETASLADLGEAAERLETTSPALIIVGEVVGIRQHLTCSAQAVRGATTPVAVQ